MLVDVQNWQMAKNLRAYIAEVTKLIEDAGLRFAKGGDVDDELSAALAYADELDPISSWRKEIQKAVAALKGASASPTGDDEGREEPIEQPSESE